MRINEKKSYCLRIGPRFDVACTHVTTADGHKLPWVSEIRYLDTFIVAGRQVRCSITHAKHSFHRALNAIFGKIGRLASEEVTLELVRRKCMPILLYGLECYTWFFSIHVLTSFLHGYSATLAAKLIIKLELS